MKYIFSFLNNLKIRTKMIIFVSGIVLLCVLPLSIIVLYRNQAIVLEKTFEVCRNLANNIANLATEELLINETYDSTRTSLLRLRESDISGLIDSYVINVDRKYVADLNEDKIGQDIPESDFQKFSSIKELSLNEIALNGKTVLRFSYPIFINYQGQKMWVGVAIFEFDKDKVYEPVFAIRRSIISVASVLFVFGIVIAILVAINFSNPIHKLSQGVKIIGDGDLNFQIAVGGKDEIGILASQFNRMTLQIRDFTQNLESMVHQRTNELNETLEKVQALKVSQDADYYLTSVLLEPLQLNNNLSKRVKTEFFIEQKKKFSFRRWNSQLGGDICVTDRIWLDGREYTVFVNGDAMGKSMQGAGGALVLGVVFNSAILRYKLSKNQRIFPETWLKERFLDLQNVFLSFDGCMYISVCMGLVDTQSGLLYYINAEHPWTVLYRDSEASFLETNLSLRKLGMPEQEEKFYIRLFQMKPADVIIIGSDGRDDILVSKSGEQDTINEDETKFLQHVKNGKGELYKIKEEVENSGSLIDDFSILRISYLEKQANLLIGNDTPLEILEVIREGSRLLEDGEYRNAIALIESIGNKKESSPDLLKLSGNIYYESSEYEKALDHFEKYLSEVPSDNECIYLISDSLKMLGRLTEAADYGERLFLRDRFHFANLLNLGKIYLDMKVYSRAKKIASIALELEPNQPDAEVLLEDIKSGMMEDGYVEEIQVIDDSSVRHVHLEDILAKADYLYHKKNYIEALESYEKANRIEGNNPWTLFRIANCHSLLNDLDKAEHFYLQSIEKASKNHHAYNNLGSVYYRKGDIFQAKLEWKKALEIKPDFKTAILNLTKIESLESNRLTSEV
ncbi:SpoIIE-like protein phosphatase domain protein [Leptospira fainei serovar Hurstbridge str. BUT 6]|uniref:SpoIIE-like protein phosphatase domain protein n=1 Tax=Leptospira fainei serovar Hurstbridge str. BUT 6 TaxID=1193011 RepID=S3V6F5_9LEPT|nr:SpoIIE family protein phosphatase [Leptospira fainei]EPG76249.1 SpoIIE-like protein phosphatase domain protein [Leptospira fainei serovar Hurstbridge str. BUT 6]